MALTSSSRGLRSSGDAPHCWRVSQRVVRSAGGTTARNWRFSSPQVHGPRGVALWSQGSRIPVGAVAEALRGRDVDLTASSTADRARSSREPKLASRSGQCQPSPRPRGAPGGPGRRSSGPVAGLGWTTGARWSRVPPHLPEQRAELQPLLLAQPEDASTVLGLRRGARGIRRWQLRLGGWRTAVVVEQLDEDAGRQRASARLLQDPLLDYWILHDYAGELAGRPLLRSAPPAFGAIASRAEFPSVLLREWHITNLPRFPCGAVPAMLPRVDFMPPAGGTRSLSATVSDSCPKESLLRDPVPFPWPGIDSAWRLVHQ
jgi:hypothetical protein